MAGSIPASALPRSPGSGPGVGSPGIRPVPRAPLPAQGVTPHSVPSGGTSESITPPSSLLRAHAPSHRPPAAFGSPTTAGLCRLLPAPAARWPFPTLSLQSVWRRLDPYPAMSQWCSCSFLPTRQRPHSMGDPFGPPKYPCLATSAGSKISGLQSFRNVQAPPLARPPGCTHRDVSARQPGRLPHASPRSLPKLGCGIATCPTRATDTVGLSPTGLQPCRPLPPTFRLSSTVQSLSFSAA